VRKFQANEILSSAKVAGKFLWIFLTPWALQLHMFWKAVSFAIDFSLEKINFAITFWRLSLLFRKNEYKLYKNLVISNLICSRIYIQI